MKLPHVAVVPCETPTAAQLTALSGWLDAHPAGAVHHLCGSAADEKVVSVACAAGLPRLVAWPSYDGRLVSRAALEASDEVRPPLPYHDRLTALARACDVVIGLVGGPPVGGRARDALDAAVREGVALRVTISPDGSVIEETSP